MRLSFVQLVLIIIASILINNVYASVGDRSQYFVNCVQICRFANCTNNGITFRYDRLKIEEPQTFFNYLLQWNCKDECKYECMWITTMNFIAEGWDVPQFYGKWPFIRFLGMQEPASVIFSLINLWANWHGIKRFRREIRHDSPMYYTWHLFSGVSINAWIWSAIFHTRDFPITELFDYVFAYSMVLTMCFCMVLRMLHKYNNKIKMIIFIGFFIFFWTHYLYLSVGHFDYQYNMKTNIITGIISSIGWLIWYVRMAKHKRYAYKMLLFQLLVGATLIFELNDFSPIFWIFDAHSIWHFVTVFPTMLLYSFIIDDCKDLKQQMYFKLEEPTNLDKWNHIN